MKYYVDVITVTRMKNTKICFNIKSLLEKYQTCFLIIVALAIREKSWNRQGFLPWLLLRSLAVDGLWGCQYVYERS